MNNEHNDEEEAEEVHPDLFYFSEKLIYPRKFGPYYLTLSLILVAVSKFPGLHVAYGFGIGLFCGIIKLFFARHGFRIPFRLTYYAAAFLLGCIILSLDAKNRTTLLSLTAITVFIATEQCLLGLGQKYALRGVTVKFS